MNPTIKLGEEYGLNITPSSPQQKRPVFKDWQNTTLTKAVIEKYIKSGHNLGFVCGPTSKDNWLVVIDFDDEGAFNHMKSKMPPTLVINTGPKGDWRGKQVYFMCDEPVDNIDIDFDNKEILSVRANGRFVVGPGSIHPSGVKYEIALDRKIETVSRDFFEIIEDEVKSYLGIDKQGGDGGNGQVIKTSSPLYSISYKDIFPSIDDGGSNIEHPVHGSETGNNFKIDENGLGHCFRHNVSIAAWQMLAVKEGLCECKDAGNGFKGSSKSILTKNDSLLNDLWQRACKLGFVQVDDKLPMKIKHLHKPTIDDIIVNTYDDKGNVKSTKVYPGVLGDYISYEFYFATLTDTDEVFVYSGGVYVPGETLIRHECQKILGSKLVKTHYVKEAIDFIRRKTFEDRESFDMDDKLINLKNGLYDIENKKLIEHTPDYLSFIQVPVEFDESATCPMWDSYLGDTLALDEDRMVLQEVAGWVFMGGYNIQKAVLLEGGGGNGKGVYLDTITELFGADNVSNVSWQDIGIDKYAKAQLYGKLANIHSDLPKDALSDTSSFKSLTGGDKIWSDVKHSIKGINFYNRAKMIYAANQIPRSKDITDAFFDRIILITFPYKIRGTKYEDKHLKEKLKKELSGIFNWALIGLNRLIENEEFSTSKTTEDFKGIYLKKSDSVFAFFNEMVREGTRHDKIPKEDVYQEYVGYCKMYLNTEPIGKQEFGKAFGKQAGWIASGQRYYDIEGSENQTRVNSWTNIRIKELPGKQNTIHYKPRSIVFEKSEPKKQGNTIHTIHKTHFPPKEISSSPDITTVKKEKSENEIISDKNKEKSIVCIDYTDDKTRLNFLFNLIRNLEKNFNGSPVYKGELMDYYQQEKLTESQLEQDIERLIKDGQIYDPNRNERYKSV